MWYMQVIPSMIVMQIMNVMEIMIVKQIMKVFQMPCLLGCPTLHDMQQITPSKNMSFQYIKILVSSIFRVFLHRFLFSLHAPKIQRILKINRGKMTRMTSNDAYAIKIWHTSIMRILVSKEALGPQLSNLWFRFGLWNCF
jgi:hypothetical protein